MRKIFAWILVALVAYPMIASTFFVVDQRQYAIVFALGEVKEVVEQPGLYFKLPAPLQNVLFMDKRILTTESNEPDRIITAEKMNILVDAFVKWRVVDAKQFFVSFSGEEQRAQDRMQQIMKAALNDEITKRTVGEVIAGDRAKLMAGIVKKMSEETAHIGIEIIDVRLKRVDYVEQINTSVYERMRAERTRVANEQRSTGAAESEKIRADADKQRTIILAEAFRDAEKIRGEGDAKASRLYAQVFGQNPEFYKFYRSLEAYRASFNNKSDVMVVDPSSEFFKYMKSSRGGGGK
ncbi:MAG: hflC [Burkholderiaceae bacterium]|nr:hflC [Burkholderiaceae bacterium]